MSEASKFDPPFFLQYIIDVSYHVAEFSKMTWEPWRDRTKTYIGWEGIPHDPDKPRIYVYLVVDVDAPHPTVRVYFGHGGDPDEDHMVCEVVDES